MKKLLISCCTFVLMSVISLCITSCNGDDDEVLKTGTLRVAVKKTNGNSYESAYVFCFEGTNYDPTTFEFSSFGSMKTTSGESKTGKAVMKFESGHYAEWEDAPSGSYYLVAFAFNKLGSYPIQSWIGQPVTLKPGESKIIDITLPAYRGCQN